jgi:hypothetical protein
MDRKVDHSFELAPPLEPLEPLEPLDCLRLAFVAQLVLARRQ